MIPSSLKAFTASSYSWSGTRWSESRLPVRRCAMSASLLRLTGLLPAMMASTASAGSPTARAADRWASISKSADQAAPTVRITAWRTRVGYPGARDLRCPLAQTKGDRGNA